MERLPSFDFTPSIQRAFHMIPTALHHRLRPDFLCGTDPIFAGLHSFEAASYGRSYRNTPHCAYPHHQPELVKSQRRTTIVLPLPEPPEVIIHELGHVMHESLLFEPVARPLNWYAETNNHEAFAEAFTAWVVPGYVGGKQDPDINGLLNHLSFSASLLPPS